MKDPVPSENCSDVHVSIDYLDYLIISEWCVTYRVNLWTSACHKPSLRWNASHLPAIFRCQVNSVDGPTATMLQYRWKLIQQSTHVNRAAAPPLRITRQCPDSNQSSRQHLLTLAEFTKVHEQFLTPKSWPLRVHVGRLALCLQTESWAKLAPPAWIG